MKKIWLELCLSIFAPSSFAIHHITIARSNRSFPEFVIIIQHRETIAETHSDLYKIIENFCKKYGLYNCGEITISKYRGEACLHESLRLIDSHIPLTPEMVEESCHSMGVGNPSICDKIPPLCEEWFQEIDQAYSWFRN